MCVCVRVKRSSPQTGVQIQAKEENKGVTLQNAGTSVEGTDEAAGDSWQTHNVG